MSAPFGPEGKAQFQTIRKNSTAVDRDFLITNVPLQIYEFVGSLSALVKSRIAAIKLNMSKCKCTERCMRI